MRAAKKTRITVQIEVDVPIDKAWKVWTEPKHVTHWNFASNDWCCPRATNDLQVGGKFNYRMESTNGEMGFDFEGKYTNVKTNELISYDLEDGRKIDIEFKSNEGTTIVVETFDAENINSIELQRNGWQAILNNYKKYAES